MFTFTLEPTHFIFNKCPIYTHDGSSAKFSSSCDETDYSVGSYGWEKLFIPMDDYVSDQCQSVVLVWGGGGGGGVPGFIVKHVNN